MQLENSLLAAVVSAVPALSHNYEVNTYWGQVGSGDRLVDYCQSSSVDYITLAFVNNSPENGNRTHYPGTNFAAHCAADVYVNNGRNSQLLSGCSFIKEDIKSCQSLGKKILLSIGGEVNSQSNYTVSTVAKGEYFAQFLFDAFGPPQKDYNGPRPFDVSSDSPTCVDGFDFDIETKFNDQEPYVAMVNKLRALITAVKADMILTAAPQCPLDDAYFQMKTILTKAQFDKIWIQFYNNAGCDATTANFNYNAWEAFIETTVNKDAALFVGLPASPSAAGSGYISSEAAKSIICDTRSKKHFGGIMLWDANYAVQNAEGSKAYYDSISEALHGSCPGDVDRSSSSSVVYPTSTSSSLFSSSAVSTLSSSMSTYSASPSSLIASSAPASSPSASSSDPYSAGTSSSLYSTSSYNASSSVTLSASYPNITSIYSPTVSSYSASPSSPDDDDDDKSSSSYAMSSTSSISVTSTFPASVNSSAPGSATSSTFVSSSTSSGSEDEDSCMDDESSSSYRGSATSSVSASTTGSYAVSSLSLAVTSETDAVTASSSYPAASSSIASYPVSSPSSSAATSQTAPATGLFSTATYPAKTTSAQEATNYEHSSTLYTTSTATSTRTYTITSCAPSVTNCPIGVVTSEIDIYTTVCPVTETEKPSPIATYPADGASSSASSDAQYTTSTVTSTRTYTITSCAPSVTSCPVGVVTSEVDIYTTVCPITETDKPGSTPTYPAGGSGNGGGSPAIKPAETASSPAAGNGGSSATKPVDTATYPAGGNGDSHTTIPAVVPTHPGGSPSENAGSSTTKTVILTSPGGDSGSSATKAAETATYPAGGNDGSSAAALPTYPAGSKDPSQPSTFAPTHAIGASSFGFLTTIVIPVYPKSKNGTVSQPTGTGTGYIVQSPTNDGGSSSTQTSSPAAISSVVTVGSARTVGFSLGGVLLAAILAL